VPRLVAGLLQNVHETPLGEAVWYDTTLLLPGLDPQQTWHNVFTGAPVTITEENGQPALAVAGLLADFPVALLVSHA